MSFTDVLITHDFDLVDGAGALGVVEFSLPERMVLGTESRSGTKRTVLSAGGILEQTVAATTAPGTSPPGVPYRIDIRLAGQPPQRYYAAVPHNQGAAIDLGTLLAWNTPPGGAGAPGGAVGYSPVAMSPVGGVLTPDATLGYGPHRYTALSDVTLDPPSGGTDGQPLEVQIKAAGGARTITVGTVGVVVPAGERWWGHFSFDAEDGEWILDEAESGAGSSGSGGSPAVSSVNGLTGAVVLTADHLTDGSTNHVFTAADDTKLAGIAAGATANATDAQLRDRATHTGVAAISTVSGLQAALDAKTTRIVTSTTRTASYALVAADVGVEQVYNSISAGTFTLPTNSSQPIAVGESIPFRQAAAGQLTIAAGGGVTLDSRGGAAKLAGQHAVAEARKTGTDTWLLAGDITA